MILFGDNVYFADGNFLYLVGQGWSSRDKKPPTRAALIAAVRVGFDDARFAKPYPSG